MNFSRAGGLKFGRGPGRSLVTKHVVSRNFPIFYRLKLSRNLENIISGVLLLNSAKNRRSSAQFLLQVKFLKNVKEDTFSVTYTL